MKHKRISLLVLVVGTLFVGFLAVRYFGWTNNPEKATMPEPNIEVQTKIVEGVTFALRNANYAENEIKVGYEVNGIAIIKDYNIICKFYNNGKDITDSNTSGGGLVSLGDKHYYLTGIEKVSNDALPDLLSLTVEITAVPSDSRLNHITASFDLSLNKEKN
ncbi:hypothetical protein [Paenibacillus sp. FSL H8-0332]|uniref:hypothetical protein n=1 Tax=Paenibacillus sp. FSL H8-0332 TaxID=2954742 RepID=UPI0030CDC1AF